ncbi:MAG: hypothetical protein ABIM02_02050 [candidate division WOR-3 bacterium]
MIGIMATGVDVNHSALKGNWWAIRGWFDAVNAINYPYNDEGHGTTCGA